MTLYICKLHTYSFTGKLTKLMPQVSDCHVFHQNQVSKPTTLASSLEQNPYGP